MSLRPYIFYCALFSSIAVSAPPQNNTAPSKEPFRATLENQLEINIIQAIKLIEKDRADDAYQLVKHHSKKNHYKLQLVVGQIQAMREKPKKAYQHFKKALKLSQNIEEKKAALFNLGKIELWLGHYQGALNTYSKLLKMPLNKSEREIAVTGRVLSLTNMDYPRTAYNEFKNQPYPYNPSAVLAGSKAAIAAGYAYKAKYLWNNNQAALKSINKNSFLDHQLEIVRWRLLENTSKFSADVNYYAAQDSDQFKLDRKTAYVSYRLFGLNSNTSLLAGQTKYFDPVHLMNANQIFLKQDFFNIKDRLDISVSGIATEVLYNQSLKEISWSPGLWESNLMYHYNDYVTLRLLNNNSLVETFTALEEKLLMNNSDFSIMLHPRDRWYGRMSGFYHRFTDHNNRVGGAANITYELFRSIGVFTELRYRGYEDSIYNDRYYFSPKSLQEATFFLIVKRRMTQKLSLYADGGIGVQSILTSPNQAAANRKVMSYDLGVSQQIDRLMELNVAYGYTQNAFNNLVGAYAQTYFSANLKMYLD